MAIGSALALAIATGVAIGCGAGGGGSKVKDDGGTSSGGNAAAGGTIGGFGGSSGDGGSINVPDGSGDACNSLTVDFKSVIPSVMLLVDRSSSMWEAGYGTSPTRWKALYDAIIGPTGAVQEFQADVRFGFTAYTGQNGGMCPLLNQVPIALANHAAIKAEYDVADVNPSTVAPYIKGETPTGVSIRTVSQTLEAFAEEGPKYILLATDGEPDTCQRFDPQCGQDESIAAVQAAYAKGVGTFVIGIGNDVGEQHLRDVANAGSGKDVQAPTDQWKNTCGSAVTATYAAVGGDAEVFRPDTAEALATKLRALIGGVRNCSFELRGVVDVSRADLCQVTLKGTPLTYQDADGWKMLTETELEVTGQSCVDIQTDPMITMTITCPCDVVTIPR